MVTVTKEILRLAKNFYHRRLVELNPVLLVMPAALVRLNIQAENLRLEQKRTEPNPVWSIPVRIESDGTSPTRFQILFENE